MKSRTTGSLAKMAALATALAGIATSASAATIVLDFAGLNGNAEEGVGNYYNGGTGSLGSGPGLNYGISFGADAITCTGQPGGACNTAQIPGGPGANALFFLTGPGDIMNVAGGFDTGFSFDYTAVSFAGTVSVWSGLDGTGTLLASLNLPVTGNGAGIPGCFGTNFCPYAPIGVTFSGTAESVNFTGTANQIAFADITLGSATPGTTVPEPAVLSLVGAGLLAMGLFARFRRRRAVEGGLTA